jgi:hypothetical protein
MLDRTTKWFGKNTDYSKPLALVSLIALNLVLVMLAITPQATGYELSIYDAYPLIFYVFYFVSFFSSLLGILSTVYTGKRNFTSIVYIGTSLVLVIVLILLPFFRGYPLFGRHDNLSHFGMISETMSIGSIGTQNFYPALHLMASVNSLITGIPDFSLARELTTPVLFLAYIAGIVLITKQIAGDKHAGMVAFAFAVIPVIGQRFGSFTSSDSALFLVPFILYIFYLNVYHNSTASKTLLIIVLLLVPYFHPEITIFFILLFSFFFILSHVPGIKPSTYESVSIHSVIILVLSFLLWLLNFSEIFRYIRRVYSSLFIEATQAQFGVEYYSGLLSRSQLSMIEFFDLIVKREGAVLIYCTLAFLVLLVVARRGIAARAFNLHYVFLGVIFLISGLLAAISLIADVVISYDRFLKFSVLLATLLISIFVATYMENLRSNPIRGRKILAVVSVLLAVALIISTFSAYSSPIIRDYNQQTTQMEINGAAWIIAHGDREIQPLAVLFVFGRLTHVIEGTESSKKNDPVYANMLYQNTIVTPDHFTYDRQNTFGESYIEDRYLINNELMRQYYFQLWPHVARYSLADYKQLYNDATVDKIYLNGELDIYYINAVKNPLYAG